jgi:hypothetical protein
MSSQITNAFVEQYSSTLQHLVQQRDSRFSGKTRVESQKGKTEFFEQLGSTSAVRRTARHGDTPRVNSNHQRRAVYLSDYEWSDLIDSQDKLKMLIDPASSYLQSAAMAFNRSIDDEILTAALGTAYADTGSGNGTVSAVTFPTSTATNVVPVNYISTAPAGSGANTGLTLAKLIRVKSLLSTSEPPEGSRMFFVHSQQQLDDLLNNVTQVSSSDYANVKALVDGSVNRFLGMDFIKHERTINRNTSTDIDTCFGYVEEGMLLSKGQDFMTRVSERADKSYSTQAYACMTIGATRMQEAEVVSCACDRSP